MRNEKEEVRNVVRCLASTPVHRECGICVRYYVCTVSYSCAYKCNMCMRAYYYGSLRMCAMCVCNMCVCATIYHLVNVST
jgi:hypothetical protein